jgi:hypothetical protein
MLPTESIILRTAFVPCERIVILGVTDLIPVEQSDGQQSPQSPPLASRAALLKSRAIERNFFNVRSITLTPF